MVFEVGQEVGAALALAPAATPVTGDAAFVLLLLELHAAVRASSPMMKIRESFGAFGFPRISHFRIIEN